MQILYCKQKQNKIKFLQMQNLVKHSNKKKQSGHF